MTSTGLLFPLEGVIVVPVTLRVVEVAEAASDPLTGLGVGGATPNNTQIWARAESSHPLSY
jgi:hypothetical protein